MGLVMETVMFQLGPKTANSSLDLDSTCHIGAGAIMAQTDSQSWHNRHPPAEYSLLAINYCCRAARGYTEGR